MARNEDACAAAVDYVRAAAARIEAARVPRREVPSDTWVREGDSFVRREVAETYVDLFAVQAELQALPEFARAVESLTSDEQLSRRFAGMTGSALGLSRITPGEVLDGVLRSGAIHGGTLAFSEDEARLAYEAAEAALDAEVLPYAVVAPLAGLEAEELPIELALGTAIDLLTDDEIVRCLRAGLLRPLGDFPVVHVGDLKGFRSSYDAPRFQLADGERPPQDFPGQGQVIFGALTALVERAILSFRLLQRGVIGAPGYVYFVEDPFHRDMTGWVPVSSSSRLRWAQYTLADADRSEIKALWEALSSDGAQQHSALSIALRRFLYSGDRDRVDDQLIDLMIAAEALFLQGEKQELAYKLALRTAYFLSGGDHPRSEVFNQIKRAYSARSAIVHGSQLRELKLADGRRVPLQEFVDTTADLMREALRKAIGVASGAAQGSIADFDAAIIAD